MKFSFGQEAQDGYILDNGRVFADQDDQGISFGWNIQNTDRTRIRT